MSVEDKVLRAVEALGDEAAAFTAEMVRIPTVNPPGDVYEDCARLIGGRLRESASRSSTSPPRAGPSTPPPTRAST